MFLLHENAMIRELCDNIFFNVGSESQLGSFEVISSIKNVVVCGCRTVGSIQKFILIICFCFGKQFSLRTKGNEQLAPWRVRSDLCCFAAMSQCDLQWIMVQIICKLQHSKRGAECS